MCILLTYIKHGANRACVKGKWVPISMKSCNLFTSTRSSGLGSYYTSPKYWCQNMQKKITVEVCIHPVGITEEISLCQLGACSPDFSSDVTLKNRDNGKFYSNREVFSPAFPNISKVILTAAPISEFLQNIQSWFSSFPFDSRLQISFQ